MIYYTEWQITDIRFIVLLVKYLVTTPSTGRVTYRLSYAAVYDRANLGSNVFDITPTFNPGVYTPDTCGELTSIGTNRWKAIHITGRVVGGDGISVTDSSPGVHSGNE